MKAKSKILKLLVVALLCAAPALTAAAYLQHHAHSVDNSGFDHYSGLRWNPGGKGLAYLHRPINQDKPAETELWKVNSTASVFDPVRSLAADFEWTLTKIHVDEWLLAEGKKGEQRRLALSASDGRVTLIELDKSWKKLPSQGAGLFFESVEESVPFDQFVDVEEAPDIMPELEPIEHQEWEPGGEEPLVTPETPPRPTHMGLKIASYDVETEQLKQLFSIPYNNDSERPVVSLMRQSPDERFLALVVQFGEASPGLWVFDSENKKLLWTRLVIEKMPFGMDWSSDSVSVAVTDKKGLAILDQALGIESNRLELEAKDKLTPMWGPGKKLYLVSEHSIYALGTGRKEATPLFDLRSVSAQAEDLVLEPISGRLAFSDSAKGVKELVVRELSSSQNPVRVAYPGSAKQEAQGTLTYQVGSAIRYSLETWFGLGAAQK